MAVKVALAFLALFGALAVAETWVRVASPLPRTQMIRGHNLRLVDGVPVWQDVSDRSNRRCVEEHPERARIVFIGSSITFGYMLKAEEVFAVALERRLNALRPTPGFCVLNFAQTGFTFDQKFVTARLELGRYRPALVMWEGWTDWRDYGKMGASAFGIESYKLRPDGFIGLAGVPDGINRYLFVHSRLYEYTALALGERDWQRSSVDDEERKFVDGRLVRVPRLAASFGAKLAMYLPSELERPLPETDASPPRWHSLVRAFGERRHAPGYALEPELAGDAYPRIRPA